jgi:PPOX class probable F420-dependent enzyme
MTTFPDSHKDFLDFPVAALTTIGDDGFPQSTLVWFLHEDGELKLSLNKTRLKLKNLRKRPQTSVLIMDPSDQMRYLEVRGSARIADDPGKSFAQRLGAKYAADVAAYDAPGVERVVVTIEPKNIYAVDMNG